MEMKRLYPRRFKFIQNLAETSKSQDEQNNIKRVYIIFWVFGLTLSSCWIIFQPQI